MNVHDELLSMNRRPPPQVVREPHLYVHLVSINMDHNKLSMLPREVGRLTNLTTMSFRRNVFRACPQVAPCPAPRAPRGAHAPGFA